LLETIDEYAVFVDGQTQIEICRDPKDNFLLSLSIDGKADFLITGDNDLLELTQFGSTSILTIADFLK
jgi:putative PIN family toxin of toxin-antitoxin system